MSGRTVVAYGTHEELLRSNAEYRRVVVRAMDENEELSRDD